MASGKRRTTGVVGAAVGPGPQQRRRGYLRFGLVGWVATEAPRSVYRRRAYGLIKFSCQGANRPSSWIGAPAVAAVNTCEYGALTAPWTQAFCARFVHTRDLWGVGQTKRTCSMAWGPGKCVDPESDS